MRRMLILLGLLFLAFACNQPSGGEGSKKSGQTSPTKTARPEKTESTTEPAPKAEVKDKSPPLGLRPAVPATFANSGWKRVYAANIPATEPATTTEYYRAEKSIGGKTRSIAVRYGNIVKEKDTIVNAANGSLLGGSGVDGAIHAAAKIDGKEPMVEEAKLYLAMHNLPSFPTGSAMATKPYGLAPDVKLVVHTVGPIGTSDSKTNLELYSAYYNSLLKASQYDSKSVSSPSISTGIYGFPHDIARELAFKAALQFFADNPNTSIEHVNFTNNDLSPTVNKFAEQFITLFP
ncbi:MAG TPA: macro domain-containing protein [Myxococcota bacterium]|nr:macro domain-containing protein [Myxococcota bacterium]